MATPSRITLVTLGVDDVPASTRFYEALGFDRSSASVDGEVSFFRNQGSRLAVWKRTELAADAGFSDASVGQFRGVATAINCDDRDQVDELIAAAGAAEGGSIVKHAKATEWGGYSGYFADPDGHLWEVAHNPDWPVCDDGLPDLPQ